MLFSLSVRLSGRARIARRALDLLPTREAPRISWRGPGPRLESVSLCTQFPGFLTISSCASVLTVSSSKLVGMFFRIVLMFVLKDFVRDCFIAQICAKMCVRTVIRAYLRDEAIWNKILAYEH